MSETLFWDNAYRANAPALLGVLRRYVRETAIAQDLLHEVFITAINKYDSYTGKGSFEGWLHRIAVNTSLMYLRNEQNKPVTADALLSVAGNDATEEDTPGDTRAAIESAGFSGEELLAAIDRLPEHHKMVFNMYVMDDFSHKQIGSELGISAGTSKSHLARARKKIQQYLYDDALNKEKNKGKRWASAFVLLFPAKSHFIDKLYRQGLSNFTLLPPGDAGFLSAAVQQHAVSVASTASQAAVSVSSTTSAVSTTAQALSAATFWGSKLSYLLMCCSTAIITSSACWLAMGDESPLNKSDDQSPAGEVVMHEAKITDATENLSPSRSPQEMGIMLTAGSGGNASQTDGQDVSDASSLISVDDGKASLQEGQVTLREGGEGRSAVKDQAAASTGSQQGNIKDDTSAKARETGIKTPSPKGKTSQDPAKNSGKAVDTTITKPTISEKQAEPVVIKKQIIQHQTIVIRDTIIITE